ncbi:GNAT family N-acetyltransferase [Sphingomonas sp.]|uniref:GNAT family N-acetyltransferase n=1 Tax=Sphingomonas sp. TaxID=28214 RepID=UPI003CC5B53B
MPERAVRLAGNADRVPVAAMLARAFADDPAMEFIFPDPADRTKRLPRLFALLFDHDAAAGMRLLTAGGEAATLWRGPGQVHTGRLAMLRRLPGLLHALGTNVSRALRVGEAIDAHMPAGAFWYLHIAGCDPAAQGRGLGAVAVRAGLTRAAGRLPAYLETATERNLVFYAGLGFAVTGEWIVPGSSLRFWSMLRPPG